MSTKNILQTSGWGSILAGVIWITLVVFVFSGRDVFTGTALDYLGVVAAALVLILALALFLQEGQNKVGSVLLALGSASLTFGILFYAIALDPEDNAAFTLFLFGTIIQGLGLIVLGFGYRSHGMSKGWSTALFLIGFALIVAFPAWFLLENATDQNITDRFGNYFWGTIMVVQAISWIILGRLCAASDRQLEDKPSEVSI